MTAEGLKSAVSAALETPAGRWLAKVLQLTALAGICYYLALKVSAIGWQEIAGSLPTSPWFYLFFLGIYFAYPTGEWLVYRRLWGAPARKRFDVFLRMRIYNLAFVSYSGEAYLGVWASRRVKQRKRRTASTIKDSQILSALSSNSLTILLLGLLLGTGQLSLFTDADPSYPLYVAIAVGLSALLIPLVLSFRHRILSIDGQSTKVVFLIHLIRLLVIVVLQIASWAVVMPSVPMEVWLVFLTGQYVLTRIPFLPNTDLLVAGLGLTLLTYVDAPAATLAGMFVAAGATATLLNFGLFSALSLRDILKRKAPEPVPSNEQVSGETVS